MASISSNVRYSKEMRDRAKVDGKELVTIAVPGIVFQTPATAAEVKSLTDFLNKWLSRTTGRSREK